MLIYRIFQQQKSQIKGKRIRHRLDISATCQMVLLLLGVMSVVFRRCREHMSEHTSKWCSETCRMENEKCESVTKRTCRKVTRLWLLATRSDVVRVYRSSRSTRKAQAVNSRAPCGFGCCSLCRLGVLCGGGSARVSRHGSSSERIVEHVHRMHRSGAGLHVVQPALLSSVQLCS